MWINKPHISKLNIHLFCNVVFAALLSLTVYFLLLSAAGFYVSRKPIDHEDYQSMIQETANEFQEYVTQENLSTLDLEAIRIWDRSKSVCHIWLIKENQVIYDSLDYLSNSIPKNFFGKLPSNRSFPVNVIHFSDSDAYLSLNILYLKRIEDQLDFLIGFVCVLLFCAIILGSFAKVVRSVLKIEKGISILESGDLSYRIDISRNDELKDLAEGINRMCRELDRQRMREERLRQKNYNLVTSISHDLRTPLTSVISYSDLLLTGNHLSETLQKRYITKIKDKAYLIKDLSDNLFTHFINRNTDYTLHLELITRNDFISYLITGMTEGLNDQGYRVLTDIHIEQEFFLKADAIQLIHVFNNLEGNILKYADSDAPIACTALLGHEALSITLYNKVKTGTASDSYGVGLQNCREILSFHHGSLEEKLTDSDYTITIALPVLFTP